MSKKTMPPIKSLTHTGPTARGGLTLGELIGRPFISDDDAISAFLNGTNTDEAKAAAKARFDKDFTDWKKGQRAGHPDLDIAESLAREIMAKEGCGARKASEISSAELAQDGVDVRAGSIEQRLKRKKQG